MQRLLALVFPLWVSVCVTACGQQRLPVALTTDPTPDRHHPAAMVTLHIPSHGTDLNGLMYLAAGAGPHPAVILLHGFPGNERNLDLAQAMRRAGWNVIYFDYRGSWGTPGGFSFTHNLEDTAAVVDFLRTASNAAQLRTDPKRIVLIGHSLGGFSAAYVAAHDEGILGFAMLSGANLGGMSAAQGPESVAVSRLSARFEDYGMEPLSGCSPETLARETVEHRSEWNFNSYAAAFAGRPVLIVTSDDGLAGHGHILANAIRGKGGKLVTEKHFATDHSYSSDRIGLEQAVLSWLSTLQQKPLPDRLHNAGDRQRVNRGTTVATLQPLY